MTPQDLTLQDVYRARQRIAPLVRETPLLASSALSKQVGASVYLKLETLQPTGAFKVRGAANKILGLAPEARARGVVTVSTGNHGRAVAHVARESEIDAVVCISERVPANKIAALRDLGPELVIHGHGQDDAAVRAEALRRERGLEMVHPFDDPQIIAGQGTLGLEIAEALPAVDTVVVPLSGGGLISGVALALKAISPAIRVVGVSMERGAVMYESLQAGRPLELREEETLADSLLGGIGLDNRYTFQLVQQYVDDVILVSEEQIAAAMAFLLFEERLVVEGAGAVGVAALLAGAVDGRPGQNIAVVLSGGNVSVPRLLEIARQYELEKREASPDH
ncbi:MAG: hydroxyectoine utilization dehydratase EutB [Candidatus Promineifilaceae bacterium]|nr:hydroxyectoine utilization dehydratase EutB [Candidatus Promineifilaceae bacterium]